MKIDLRYFKPAVKNATIVGMLTFIVLMLFNDKISEQTPLISLGYGFISFISTLPVYYVSGIKHWNEGKVLSWKRLYSPLMAYLLTLVFGLTYTMFAYGHNPIDFFFYHDGKLNTVSLGSFFKITISAVVLFYIVHYLGASTEREIIVNTKLRNLKKESGNEYDSSQTPKIVRLYGGTRNSVFDLDIRRFLYAESSANYLKINVYGDQLETITLRMTLKQFEEATEAYPEIVKCHRAFITNIKNISYYSGNADKGELHFAVVSNVIPVSKTYATAISEKLNNG